MKQHYCNTPQRHHYNNCTLSIAAVVLFIVFFQILFHESFSLPGAQLAFPNVPKTCMIEGKKVYRERGFVAFGHYDCWGNAGKGNYLAIGHDFLKIGKTWNLPFCLMDSDNDGVNNGEELGDPCCMHIPKAAKHPLILESAPSDPSNPNDRPSELCADTILPIPDISEMEVTVGESKILLSIPDFMTQRSNSCVCRVVVTLSKPNSISRPNAMLSPFASQQSPIPGSNKKKKNPPKGYIYDPNDRLAEGYYNLTEEALSDIKRKSMFQKSILSKSSMAKLVAQTLRIAPELDDEYFEAPKEYKKFRRILQDMDEEDPDSVTVQFPASQPTSPVVCSDSNDNGDLDLGPFINSDEAEVTVRFSNWLKVGSSTTRRVKVTYDRNVDRLPCNKFVMSPTTVFVDNFYQPIVEAAIFFLVVLVAMALFGLLFRCLPPANRFRHFFMGQKLVVINRELVGYELFFAILFVLIIVNVAFLVGRLATDPKKHNNGPLMIVGLASGYAATFFFAAVMVFSVRQFSLTRYAYLGSFEAGLKYHIMFGHMGMVLMAIHGFIEMYIKNWDFRINGMLNGLLCGLSLFIGYIPTFEWFRNNLYEVFRLFHYLMILGLALALWHLFGFYDITHTRSHTAGYLLALFVGLFALDKLICVTRDKIFLQSRIIRSRFGNVAGTLLGNEHILLTITKPNSNFKAGHWINLWIPTLGAVSHPFSIMPAGGSGDIDEAAKQNSFELIIRIQSPRRRFGFYTPWTVRLQQLMKKNNNDLSGVKVFAAGPFGYPTVGKIMRNVDSVILIAGGSGISAVLADLSAIPEEKLNQVYWSFRPPFLFYWLRSYFACAPPNKRSFFCTGKAEKDAVMAEGANTLQKIKDGSLPRNTPLEEELKWYHMDAEREIRECCDRAVLAYSGPKRYPKVAIVVCGPSLINTKVVEAYKMEKLRRRVKLIIEVQAFNF